MEPRRTVNHKDISFENGDVFIKGELYGYEFAFWEDVDAGIIEYIPPTINETKKESGEHLLDPEYWNEPY